MEILVYKTNINEPADIETLSKVMIDCSGVISWHVDLEDHDKVLRIEAINNITSKVESVVTKAGYSCLPLE